MSKNIRPVEAKTQTEAIMKHLKKYGSITSMEAYDMYGATRLAAIIFVLRRKLNWSIENKEHTIHNRYGETCNFVEYVLVSD